MRLTTAMKRGGEAPSFSNIGQWENYALTTQSNVIKILNPILIKIVVNTYLISENK